MPSTWVPRTLTPCFRRTPESSSWMPQFSAVCPPKPSSMASGASCSMTLVTDSRFTGTKWMRPENCSLVWMVAMLGLTRTDSTPSSFRALRHWLPE